MPRAMKPSAVWPANGALGANNGVAGVPTARDGITPRLSAHARGIAPLWNAGDVAALLSRRHPAIAGEKLELISIRRGALRLTDERLDATYEVVVGERAAGAAASCVPATPERRFALIRVPLGSAAPSLEDAEVFLSPDDPRFESAEILTDALMSEIAGAAVHVAASEIVAHRFGSRIAWRVTVLDAADARELFVKMRRSKPARALFLAGAELGAVAETPRRVGGMQVGAATFDCFEWVRATCLHERLIARSGAAVTAGMSDAAILRTTGAAIADLHARARLGDTRADTRAPRRDLTSEFAQLRALAATAARFFDGVAEPVAAALARLGEPAPPLSSAPIHGDLHDKQILLRPGGAVFIDLDNAGLGEPELDLANLTAHLALRALQSARPIAAARAAEALIIDGYLAAGGSLQRARLARYREATLVRLALLYLMRLNSSHLFASLLDEAKRSHEEG
ncbi:MAG: phosphotransferase [bacterium]